MLRLMIALGALVALEAPALACACLGPQDAKQKREWARDIVKNAVAIAEVEQIEDMDLSSMRPELYRVHKVLVGKAPKTFRLYRRFEQWKGGLVNVDITDCEASPNAGERKVVVLYDPKNFEANLKYYSAEERAKVAKGDLDIWSMCEKLFFELGGGMALALEEARKLGKLAN